MASEGDQSMTETDNCGITRSLKHGDVGFQWADPLYPPPRNLTISLSLSLRFSLDVLRELHTAQSRLPLTSRIDISNCAAAHYQQLPSPLQHPRAARSAA